ncbi:MAG TPA: VWA domain-containing protein [Acidobacteriaceae bacterium]|jgi:VWFA-related protein|nr:VWA domain-containing protein [Acidobacteriaceae bacterium]
MRARSASLATLFALALTALVPAAALAQQPASPPDSAPSSPALQAPQSPAPIQRQSPEATAPPAPSTTAPPTAANTITRNVRLVVLDLVVLDKKGNVVNNLTRDDFHVEEDGVEQTIRNFDPPGKYTPAPDITIDSTADLDRLAPRAPVNIILLDEFNTRFEDMAFARYSLKKWLDKQPAKLDTPTMLVSVSLEKFEVLHDYTQNKGEILSALDHHFVAFPWQVHQFAWVSERYATAFFTLRRVAEATTGHPGHKTMIWIGRGLPNIDRSRFDIDDEERINTAVQQTVNELRDARVTLYTIDPAGLLVNPGVYGRDAALFDPFGGEPNFQALATATGGRNLYGRNDVDAEIGTSIRDGASFYTLTYRPTDAVRDIRHFRKIDVTVVGRPDFKVVTRQGYFDSRAPARLRSDGEVTKRLASELVGAGTSNMAYDAIPLTLNATPTPGRYIIHLEGRGLYWTPATDTSPRTAKLILFVTLFDKKGKLLKSDGRSLVVSAPTTVPPTGRLNRAINLDYQLPPSSKAVRARFVIRVDATGRMGTADADLTRPLPPPPAPTIDAVPTPPSP